MQEQEIEVKSGDITLSGTLTSPDIAGPYPLVICIHGSGPLDRNENAGKQKLNIFNDLAAQLAGQGIACYRYDKRGIGKSGGKYISASHSDLVMDATAVAQHFYAVQTFSKLFLLGHSEGTIIAPQVAQNSAVDGLILLAPFVTPLEQILDAQGVEMQTHIDSAKGIGAWFIRGYVRLSGGVKKINQRLIRRVLGSDKPVIWSNFRQVEAAWIREMLLLDPVAVFAKVNLPTLLLVAGKDAQCPPEDGAKITDIIGADATHVIVPKLSHILRFEGDKQGFAGYAEQLKKPMEPVVSETIVDWLERF